MKSVGKAADPAWPDRAYSAQEIKDRITLWREHLLEHREGRTNCTLRLEDIRRELDRWLDQWNDLKGR